MFTILYLVSFYVFKPSFYMRYYPSPLPHVPLFPYIQTMCTGVVSSITHCLLCFQVFLLYSRRYYPSPPFHVPLCTYRRFFTGRTLTVIMTSRSPWLSTFPAHLRNIVAFPISLSYPPLHIDLTASIRNLLPLSR